VGKVVPLLSFLTLEEIAIKEIQIKAILTLHLTPVRMAIFKNTTTNVSKDAAKQEPLYTVGVNVN
jgi:hypothetical protein